MPNRHDGASSPEWWDDLPPEVRRRISRPDPAATPDRGAEPAREDPAAYRPAILADLSRLAALFFVIVLANVVFLLIALSFLANRASSAPT